MGRDFRQSRFKSEYHAIDAYRFNKLMAGSLRDVIWSATASEGLGVWVPKKAIAVSEVEGDNTFIPGQ
jgi:hypothetical protein